VIGDLRLTLAQDIAEQIDARIYPGRCDCGWPLMVKEVQGMPFCWNCTADRVTAERGRNLLERIKQGITITHIGNETFLTHRAA